MSTKPFVIAIVLAFVVPLVVDILLNAVVPRDVYEASRGFWLPPEQLNRLVPFGWLSMLLLMAALGALYRRTHWRGTRRGL